MNKMNDKTEDKLKHLASFPQLNPNPVIEVDFTGKITYSNPATQKILKNLGMSKGDVTFFLPADLNAVMKDLKKEDESFLYREIMIKDRIFEETIHLSHQFKAVRIYAHDITARKRAEEALKESERVYRAIGESIDFGIWICDPDGRNIYASDSFLKLVGMSQEQCSNFGWGAVLHPDDAERTIATWKECVRTGCTWDIEHRFRGVDGHWYPALARGVPVRDEQGKVKCWAGINLDISRIKLVEGSLRESEERLRLAHQAAKIGAFEWNVQTGVNVWTQEMEMMYGLARGEFGETQAAWMQLIYPEDREAAAGWVNQAFQTGEPVEGEWRVVWPDGSVHWISGRFQVFKDATGKPLRVSGVNMDITERKRVEEALSRLNTELEQRVAEPDREAQARDCRARKDRAEIGRKCIATAINSPGRQRRPLGLGPPDQ